MTRPTQVLFVALAVVVMLGCCQGTSATDTPAPAPASPAR